MTNFSNGPRPNPARGAPPPHPSHPRQQHGFGAVGGPGGSSSWGGGQPTGSDVASPHGFGAATAQPPHGPPPEPTKNRKPLIVTAGATVVVLTVVAVIVGVLVSTGKGGGSLNTSGSPTEVAKAYLEALSRGDAAAALGYSAMQPASTELLTNDILKMQLEKLPLTDVEVVGQEDLPNADKRTAVVNVAAKFGGQRTEGKLSMVVADNQWKLSSAFVEGTIEKVKGLPDGVQSVEKSLTVFGKPMPQSLRFYVFPGYLQLGSAGANLNINELPPTTFDDANGYIPTTIKLKFSITDAGRQAAQDALRAWIDKCYNGAESVGECKGTTGGYANYYDLSTIRVRGPVDFAGVEFKLPDYTSVVNVYNLDVPITAVDKHGKVVEAKLDTGSFLAVNIGEQPPRVFIEG